MSTHHRIPAQIASRLVLVVCLAGLLTPAIANQVAAQPKPTIEESLPFGPVDKTSLLAWIDAALPQQVLFRPEDIKAMRERVEKMNDEEVQKYIRDTSEVRLLLESDVWRDTNEWLREFLKVQAIYSDKEVEDLKTRIGKMKPSEQVMQFEKILDRRIRSLRKRNLQDRSQSLSTDWRKSNKSTRPNPVATNRSPSRTVQSTTPAQPSAKVRQYNYRPPGPLINSREVARGAVFRSVFPYRGW